MQIKKKRGETPETSEVLESKDSGKSFCFLNKWIQRLFHVPLFHVMLLDGTQGDNMSESTFERRKRRHARPLDLDSDDDDDDDERNEEHKTHQAEKREIATDKEEPAGSKEDAVHILVNDKLKENQSLLIPVIGYFFLLHFAKAESKSWNKFSSTTRCNFVENPKFYTKD